ncbi:uncharacterized protein B0P05DRAFT_575599 [Gilbertella persicaria]|uniref:uncharacterized protein n=1 Tax=Gilbertella persicaria TaxID=101096 RepID=UPI00221F11F5|nr:uncharacterized protein B0P05DRAFT_575599 [Gilbertella persicaria]KAI8051882.1 hypothetical protein B0P05DRAFT_575599 [Gilbertella persicaria]
MFVEMKVKDDGGKYTVTTFNPTVGLHLLKHLTEDFNHQMVIEGTFYVHAWLNNNGAAAMTKKMTLTKLIYNNTSVSPPEENVRVHKFVLLKHVIDKFYDDKEFTGSKKSLDDLKLEYKELHKDIYPNIPIEDVKFSTEEIKNRRDREMQAKRNSTAEIALLLKEKMLQMNTVALITDSDLEAITKKRKFASKSWFLFIQIRSLGCCSIYQLNMVIQLLTCFEPVFDLEQKKNARVAASVRFLYQPLYLLLQIV